MRSSVLLLLTVPLVSCALLAQGPPAATEPPAAGAARGTPEPRPYEKVVTKDFKTESGLFKVHTSRDRVLYEIPKAELNTEFLWVSQIRRTTIGAGYGGQAAGNRVVRWEQRERRVFLRNINYDIVADPQSNIARAVKDANEDAILMAFNIEAFNKDGEPVIDVTRLFTSDTPEFSGRVRVGARAMDAARSYVDQVAVFPINIEVDAVQTYTTPTDPAPAAAPAPMFGSRMRPGSGTVVMHYSMVRLPGKPMTARLADDRTGYFSVSTTDFSRPENKAQRRTFITRYRLEKKNPSAAMSEPVKPITYYIDPATPKKWWPAVKAGIEAWQPAFEQAGFLKGIVCKQPPSKEEDPHWAPEDARYSVVRWLPSNIENAVGPHVHDPRSGEILEADVQFYHNVMNLAQNWYFVQASPLDARAQKLPLSDDLMARLVEYVVAHEVGHTLGLQHNMKASSLFTLAQVRDPKWLKEHGHTPTLMDYSRFNYVAQPEDKVDPADLIPKISDYDKWIIMWGYKPIPDAETPDAERMTLDAWARAQEKNPHLRFSTAGAAGSDPGDETEAVGDIDAVAATTLGLKNLERVAGYLLQATEKPGEDWDLLQETYGRVLGQWSLEMGHVANLIGGYETQQLHGGQAGVRFKPLPRERQTAAVNFLLANALRVPKWALKIEILRRLEPNGAVDRVRQSQQRVLNSMLNNMRLNRLTEQEAVDGIKGYTLAGYLTDVRKGIYSELAGTQVSIDVFRRNTQRLYLEAVNDKLNGRTPATDDIRALLRAELWRLSDEVTAAAPRSTNPATRAHLDDVKYQIARILDPKFAPPAPAANPPGGPPGRGADDMYSLDCWRDFNVFAAPRREP